MHVNRLFGGLSFLAATLLLLSGCSGSEDVEGRGGDGGAVSCTTDADCDSGHCGPDGSCVACVADIHCPADAPACSDGACVACLDDSACTGRSQPRCDVAEGACVACLDNADCNGGLCHPDKRCVECITGSDCPSGACEAGVCTDPNGCSQDRPCDDGLLCILDDFGNGRCEELCNPETGGPCTGDDLCSLATFTQDLDPVGACVAPTGGAGEQQDCSAFDCEVNLLCVSYGDGDRCSRMCDETDESSCGEGFRCVEISFTAPAGAVTGVCVPVPRLCESDGDCDAGQVCTITWSEADGLQQVCATSVGAKAAGEDCSNDAECASNFCLDGQQVCYGVCEGDADCATGSTCVQVSFSLPDGGVDTAPACFPTCTDDASCGGGQTCSLAINLAGDQYVTVCNPGAGGTAAGEACTDPNSCRSGRCEAGSTGGYCYGLCDDDGDCGGQTECVPTGQFLDVGPDGTWNTEDDVYQVIGQCRGAECTSDAECGGWACVPEQDNTVPGRDQVIQRCDPAVGTRTGGEACGSASECRSNICSARVVPEDCNDAADNDGDGQTDCDDIDCYTTCRQEWDCGDGTDNDGDGAADCDDGDCDYVCNTENDCANGLDDDGNGLTDCADPDCRWSCGQVEWSCSDGRDDDADGFTDCDDLEDCEWASNCREMFCGTSTCCTDSTDNDGDGFSDCADTDCRGYSPCNGQANEGSTASDCSDGEDDDADGFTDCADQGCKGIAPCTESSCTTGDCCGDGQDNDDDGRSDCLDADCAADAACNELGRCGDGTDNDGDRLVDCFDDDCSSDALCNERSCTGGNCCNDGLDNDGDGGLDCADANCTYDAACNEQQCGTGNCCADGVDSDDDGGGDCADYDCRFASSCYEFSCADGVDNDLDGDTDCADSNCFGNSQCPGARVCFEACGADADCQSGMVCDPDAVAVSVSGRGDYVYVDSCAAPE